MGEKPHKGLARGSLSEIDTQIEIFRKLDFIKDENELMKKMEEVGLLLYGLIESRRKLL